MDGSTSRLIETAVNNPASFVFDRLQTVSVPARKLFTVIVHEAYHGPFHPKPNGTATPPEILEACGLDVAEFYALLTMLGKAGLIQISNTYPFEEIQISPEAAEAASLADRCRRENIPLEDMFVNLARPQSEHPYTCSPPEAAMTFNNFPVPPDQRFFEDYKAGHVYEFGTITVSEPEIIEFARRYDPQYFHLDPAKAAASEFGGIIASGFHTTSLAMRLYVDHYLSHVASLASPGIDDIRWPNPLRPGDTVRIRVTILEARLSRSKPDRGTVSTRVEAINQTDHLVLSMTVVSILGRRPDSSATL
jgi:acyl dehydratase